ncbi:MAG: glycerophosphodiester phosphodiesterase [Desulfopila sp.]
MSSCTLPDYVISLENVFEREKMHSRNHYDYRCTAGAHRGASDIYRENTMAALLAAENNDEYGFVEFDVQYAKDGTIVVYHDHRMLRLFGSLKTISDTTYAELSRISDGEIAAYHTVMDRLEKKLNIEIKSQGDSLEDRRLADEIISDIRTRKRTDDILISSISGDVISYISMKYPDIPTGQIFWLTSSTYLPFDALTEKLYARLDETQADYLMLHVANLRNVDDLLKLKPSGITLVFWDFDENIYIVHRNLSDRLWGESAATNFFRELGHSINEYL